MIREFLLKNEFGRFLIVGCANTAFALALIWVFTLFVHYLAAYTLGYIGGILFSYWLNTRWVFRTAPNWKSFFAFPLVYVIQYVLNMVMLYLLVEVAGWSEWLAPLAVAIFSIPITFVLSRFVIKRPH